MLSLTAARGEWPWIALVLAVLFGFYGLLRKRAPVDGLVGLSVEVLLLLPLSSAYLLYLGLVGELSLGARGAATDLLVLLSGVVTAVPLVCFGEAARRLPLSTLGFLQYLGPSLQLVLAVLVFGEPFRPAQQVGFGCIWAALLLVSLDTVRGPGTRPPALSELPSLVQPNLGGERPERAVSPTRS